MRKPSPTGGLLYHGKKLTMLGLLHSMYYNNNYPMTTQYYFCGSTALVGGPGSSVGIVTELRAGRSVDQIPVGARFFAHVQTGPGAHPASCTRGTGSFPGVKRQGRGANHTPPSSAEVENE
jgi:hypothetical protein